MVEAGLAVGGSAGCGSGDLGLGALGVAASDDRGDGSDGRRRNSRPMAMVLLGFFVRLAATIALLYVSLKVLNGSVYALAAGLALGVFALTVEGLRLVKAWTV